MQPGFPKPVADRTGGFSKQARVAYASKLKKDGQEAIKTEAIQRKVEARQARAAVTPRQLRPGGKHCNTRVPMAHPRGNPKASGRPRNAPSSPTKRGERDMRLVHGSSANFLVDDEFYESAGDEYFTTKLVSGPSAALTQYNPGDESFDGEMMTTTASTLSAAAEASVGQLGQGVDSGAGARTSDSVENNEGVKVDVVVAGPHRRSKGSSSGGWGSSSGSPRNSAGGAVLDSVGHFMTHTVPKKARRLTDELVGLGGDMSQGLDTWKTSLKESSSKLGAKMEAGWDKLANASQEKLDRAAERSKGWLKGLKSLLVCGGKSLPVEV